MEINNWKTYLYLIILLIIVYIAVGMFYDQDIKINQKYSIATLIKVEYVGRSATNRIVFNYDYETKSIRGTYRFSNDSTKYYESQIGEKYLVKMSDKQWVNRFFYTYKLYMNKPVPDSVKVPSEGWKELPNWAK